MARNKKKKKKQRQGKPLTRQDVKKKAVALKGGKCQNCGYDKCMAALTFHHINPADKKFDISQNFKLEWDQLLIELDKTVLLCSNCHTEVHFNGLIIKLSEHVEGTSKAI